MPYSYEDVIGARTGMTKAGVIVRALKREGWTVFPSAELLALKRAAARLEKMEAKATKTSTNGKGATTGRFSAAKPNLAQAPRGKRAAPKKATPAKAAKKAVAPKKAAAKKPAPKKAVGRVVLPPTKTPEQQRALAAHKAATPRRSVPRRVVARKGGRSK